MAPILELGDALLRGRLPEAGPAGTRIELGVRPVQRFPAADADVDALVLAVVVLSRVGGLGPAHTRDGVLLGGELGPPLLFDLGYFRRHGEAP